eukprot:5398041-Amphidinium_carterae.1
MSSCIHHHSHAPLHQRRLSRLQQSRRNRITALRLKGSKQVSRPNWYCGCLVLNLLLRLLGARVQSDVDNTCSAL